MVMIINKINKKINKNSKKIVKQKTKNIKKISMLLLLLSMFIRPKTFNEKLMKKFPIFFCKIDIEKLQIENLMKKQSKKKKKKENFAPRNE